MRRRCVRGRRCPVYISLKSPPPLPMGGGAFLTSPSTRSLARPPRDAMAARSRAPGRGSAHSPRPSRRVHANVQVEVLCAHNGTQHQPKHKNTPQASERPISGPFPHARTRNDLCYHGSAIEHAHSTPHRPHLPSNAKLGNMSGKTIAGKHTALHDSTTATRCESMAMRAGTHAHKQREQAQHAQQRAKGGASQRVARQLLSKPRAAPAKLGAKAAYVPSLVNDVHTCPRMCDCTPVR